MNPWLTRGPVNIAHQGGALESPANTLYAFARAVGNGAHCLELDVHSTADDHLVVLHDESVDRTTDGHGRVDEMTLSDLRGLDAAHWFVPGRGTVTDAPADLCPMRGVATGEKPPPDGFTPGDFTIPTLAEVLGRFPRHFVNIDIKNTAPQARPYEATLGALLAQYGRTDDVIVASFLDHALDVFRSLAPGVCTSAGPSEVAAFWTAAQRPDVDVEARGYEALQVPCTYRGAPVVTQALVDQAHACGVAVHVWTVNEPALMRRLLDLGVDGIVTDRPRVLAGLLA